MYAFGFDSPILNIFSYPQGAVKKLAFFYSPFFVDISMFFGVTNQLLARSGVFLKQLIARFGVFSESLFARLRLSKIFFCSATRLFNERSRMKGRKPTQNKNPPSDKKDN